MKKLILVIILFLIFPIRVNAISAEAVIVMDADSGRVLYGKNINKQKLIASTTKIMTCLLAIENGNLDQKITVTEEILKAYGSAIYIELGEELTLRDLLYGLMLRSGNDAAIMIAVAISGNMEKFAALMNYRAGEIGMRNTVFYNSHGLEEKNNVGNKSTAYDMALLTREAIKTSEFLKIFGTKKYTTTSNFKSYSWTNKNKLLTTYEFTTGGKTGYTELAKRTLVTTASKDNKKLIVVTLNDGNDFSNHKELYIEYFNKYHLVKVLNKNNFKVLEDSYYKNETLVIKNNFNMLVTSEEEKSIRTVIELDKVKRKNDDVRVGTAKVYLGDELIGEEGIYIELERVTKKQGFWAKLLDFVTFWN